jgi:uncharacterized membrane protein
MGKYIGKYVTRRGNVSYIKKGLKMSAPKKIDHQTMRELRNILSKLSINQEKVTIDLKNQTIEVPDTVIKEKAWTAKELISVAKSISPQRAKEMLAEVEESRSEWDEER